MTYPIFPIRPDDYAENEEIFSIYPYRFGENWVFDDPRVSLVREPFVSGITEMIDALVAEIPDAEDGFKLSFSLRPFDEYQGVLIWLRADPIEGNWYRHAETGEEGWLCPALFCYFNEAPERIFVRAEAK